MNSTSSKLRRRWLIAVAIMLVLLWGVCLVVGSDDALQEMTLEELRAEYDALPDSILEKTARRRQLSDRIGEVIPTEDIIYGKISCREANMIQRAEVRQMRLSDEDVTDSEIENSVRYAKAERVKEDCRNNAPEPTPIPVEMHITARQLADDFEANEVAANRKYKGKYAKIDGFVESVGAGSELNISDGNTMTLFAYALIHPIIPCFVEDDTDSLASLVKGQPITVEGRIMGYLMLEVEGLTPVQIIDILSCSIVK